MEKDRKVICDIISDMLDNPNEVGIYPTSIAFDKLEKYISQVRAEALGWTHAFACWLLDEGRDLREFEIPKILSMAEKDLSREDK